MNKIKVVISGFIFPMTMLHYFWRAFERRNDVDLFVTGPFSDDWIPWMHGMKLPKQYVKMPNLPLPLNVINIKSSIVETQLSWKPDLWLEIDAGWHFANRPDARIVVHIQTDPHVLKSFYNQIKGRSDYTFCMQSNYMENGENYLPYGFDPTIHFPEEQEKTFDACLIGLQYDNRTELVNALEAEGLNVFYTTGLIYDEYRMMYNKSKVALSWSSLQDLPARVWEAMGMNIPLVTNRVPDLKNFFVEGDHYLGFDTVSEGVAQVKKLLNNPDYAKEMAENAYRKVSVAHTWDHRVSQILNTVKLI